MNDMILNMLANDCFTVSDFKAVGLTAENTKLESEDKYLQSQKIQENELFKDTNTGEFSKDLFHQYYLEATDLILDIENKSDYEDSFNDLILQIPSTCDCLVLGCTHLIKIKDVFKKRLDLFVLSQDELFIELFNKNNYIVDEKK